MGQNTPKQPDAWDQAAAEYAKSNPQAAKGTTSAPATSQTSGDASNDDWKVWQQGSEAAPETTGLIPAIRNYVDKLTAIEPFDARPGIGGHILTGVGNVGGGVLSPLQMVNHPLNTLEGLGRMTPAGEFVDTIRGREPADVQLVKAVAKNPLGMAESLAGSALTGQVLDELGPVVGAGLKRGSAGIVNKKLGALQSDFDRGANPGVGYLDNLGPSLSMRSIANKADAALSKTGAKIGSIVDSSTAQGVKMPWQGVHDAVAGPVSDALKTFRGPGGDVSKVDDVFNLENTYHPLTAKPLDPTPRDVFDAKLNTARNTSWGDPSQPGMQSLRQQLSGTLGDTLSEQIPELRPVNSQYQNLLKLRDRSAARANSSSALSNLGRRGLEIAGAVFGASHGSPLYMAPLALDTIPAATTIAKGGYMAGKAIPYVTDMIPFVSPANAVIQRFTQRPSDDQNK